MLLTFDVAVTPTRIVLYLITTQVSASNFAALATQDNNRRKSNQRRRGDCEHAANRRKKRGEGIKEKGG